MGVFSVCTQQYDKNIYSMKKDKKIKDKYEISYNFKGTRFPEYLEGN